MEYTAAVVLGEGPGIMMIAALKAPWTWWLVIWGSVAALLLALALGMLPFGAYLVGLLVAALSAIVIGVAGFIFHSSERQWFSAAIGALLLLPLAYFWSFIDVGIRAGDWAYFQSKRGAFQARVAGLPAASEPRFLGLESESLGSALTGPIERSFVYDESGRVAGPTPEEAAEFRARFFPSRAAADYCTRFQYVRPLGGHFYVIRGICEFPQ